MLRFSRVEPSHTEWWKEVGKSLIMKSVDDYVFPRQFDTEQQLSLLYFLDLCSEKSSHPSSLIPPCCPKMSAAFVQMLFKEEQFTHWQVAGAKRSFSPDWLRFCLILGW